jgi:hypothetical protein
MFLEPCRSCLASSPPPATSPLARTRRGQEADRRRGPAGSLMQIENLVQGPQCKYTETPFSMYCYFMWVMLLSCKIHRKPQKNPQIAKLVLLETRFQTLQLLFMKFDMKLNIFASILNLKLEGNWCITSTFLLCCL